MSTPDWRVEIIVRAPAGEADGRYGDIRAQLDVPADVLTAWAVYRVALQALTTPSHTVVQGQPE